MAAAQYIDQAKLVAEDAELNDQLAIAEECDLIIAEQRAQRAIRIERLVCDDEGNPERHGKEIATRFFSGDIEIEIPTIIQILETIEGKEDEGIDPRFDRVVDAVIELPDAQRAMAIALWKGFLARAGAA